MLKQKLNFLKLNLTYYFISNLQRVLEIFQFCKHEINAKCLLPLLLLCCFSFSHSPEQNPPWLHQQLIPSHTPVHPYRKTKAPAPQQLFSLPQDKGLRKRIILCIYIQTHKASGEVTSVLASWASPTQQQKYFTTYSKLLMPLNHESPLGECWRGKNKNKVWDKQLLSYFIANCL